MCKNNWNKCIPVLAIAALVAFSAASCSKDDDLSPEEADLLYPNALVTVKTTPSGAPYFWLDAQTTLEPKDWGNVFVEETRALLNYTELPEASSFCTKKVRVNWIRQVLTKDARSGDKDEGGFGSDPVEVLQDWMTVCEDGYLTLHFAAPWGSVQHTVQLVRTSVTPLLFTFRHDSGVQPGADWEDAVVSFRIAPLMSEGADSFRLEWNSFSGVKTLEIEYE